MARPIEIALLIVLAGAVVSACGETTTERKEGGVDTRVARASGASSSTNAAPCEILDDELIRRHFDTAGAEITRKPSQYSPHPLCTVSWPKPNAAQLEQQWSEQLAEHMTRRMQGEDVKMPSRRTNDEVSLTIFSVRFDSPGSALAAFDSAMRAMAEGRTIATRAGSVESPRYELEPAAGVGQKAMWAPRLRQLSVVTSDRIFHVAVQTDSEIDRDLRKAQDIAREIAAAL